MNTERATGQGIAVPALHWDAQRRCVRHEETEQPLMDATLRCFVQPGPDAVAALGALLSADPGMRMRQSVLVVQKAHAVLDEEGRQLAAIFAEKGKPVVCSAGCTGCCCQLVLCRPFEARLIAAFLEAMPDKREAFATAYAVWDRSTAALRFSYLAWAEKMYTRGEDDGSHAVGDFQTPCPFLDVQGRCEIYAVRPYACRSCMALDPACPATPPGHNALHMQYSLYTAHHASRQAVSELLLQGLAVEARPASMPDMVAALLGG